MLLLLQRLGRKTIGVASVILAATLILVFQNCGSYLGKSVSPSQAEDSQGGASPSPIAEDGTTLADRLPQFVEKPALQLMEATSYSVSFAAVSQEQYCRDAKSNPVYSQPVFFDLDLKTPIDPQHVSIGKAIWVQMMIVNCTNEDWGSGFRLGSAAPQDNFLWGVNRVNFPADIKSVPRGHQLTLRFIARAPTQAGSFALSFAVLKEGSKWFTGAAPILLGVQFPAQSVAAICPDIDPTIRAEAGKGFLETQILECIKKTPNGGVLEIAPGAYYLTRKIFLDRPITLRTRGQSKSPDHCLSNAPLDCAIFIAHPAFNAGDDKTANAYNGLLVASYVSKVHVDHLVFHGNRTGRIGTAVDQLMQADRSWGANATFTWCNQCTISYSASVNSLGSSGLQFIGDDAVIVGNVVRDGGQAPRGGGAFINDGFTILDAQRIAFINNIAMNNTDIDMIFAHIKDGTVRNNVVLHETSSPMYDLTGAMGGMMLDNFNVNALSDSSGSTMANNWINCNGTCQMGLQLGPYPWYPGSDGAKWESANETRGCVQAGTILNNVVMNAKQGINIAGAKGTLRNNIVNDSLTATRLPFITCASHERSRLNHEPLNPNCQSDVGENFDFAGTRLEVTRYAWDNCY